MKVLISGNEGFVGTNLSQYLTKEGIEVGRFSLRDSAWEEADWGDTDHIVHAAGYAHDVENVMDAEYFFKINTELTKLVFQKFLASSTNTFIFISSVKAVTDTVNEVLIESVIHPNPNTPYGKSKLAAETYILNQKIPADKRVIILRPCMIHGPGNKGNLKLLHKFVSKGIPYPLGKYNNIRSFLSIENLCYAINLMMKKPDFKSGVYNVADDEPLSVKRIIAIMADIQNKRPKIWNVPIFLITLLKKTGDIFKLPINSDRVKKLTESYIVSNEKCKKELGISRFPISAEEGMRITLKSFE